MKLNNTPVPPRANVHVKYQPFKDYNGQHCYAKLKGEHVTLHIANLYFLSINILHLQFER